MKQEIASSPLAVVHYNEERPGELPLLDVFGAAIDLLRHTQWQGQQPLGAFVGIALSALKESRAHLVLTEDRRPLGFAVWRYLDEASHAEWLCSEAHILHNLAANDAIPGSPQFLWFTTLITPFSTPLPLLSVLRERHATVPAAWATCPERVACRRVW